MTQLALIEERPKRPSLAKRRKSRNDSSKSERKAAATSNVINLRADAATRSLIDRAAAASGQNRTEFMLRSARIQAEHVLLSQVYFQLGDDDWDALNKTLSSPPPPSAALKRLRKRKPAWDV